ncbi:MAG: radical SAM protein [Peptococcaceae bacterium]|nr:radical SAM protein [Peptococcaceae bacterium]
MKVFFVNPPFKAQYGKFSRESRSPAIGHSGVLYYPLWLIYSAAVVEKEGFGIEFLDAPAKRMDEEASFNYIDQRAEGTRLFVIDTSTPSIYSDVTFAGKIKDRYPQSFILLVGTHPSSTAEETMELDSRIDGIARKEYDYIVKNLAQAIEKNSTLENIEGLTYRRNNEIIQNPDAEYIHNLDEIPFAAEFIKKHLDIMDYFFPAASYPSIQIFTGRGCPARCTFCVYPQTLHGHEYRLRSAENVINEMKYIADNFPTVKEIVIEDDTFTVNKKRVIEMCNLIIQNDLHKRLKWLCNARVNLDYETMKLMKQAGCHLIIPGIESVNETILNNIKKGITVKHIEEYMANAKKAGLMVHACYMVGNKGETRETMNETLKASLRFKTDTVQFFPLVPYPGTEAYLWAKTNGYINGRYDEYCKEDGTINCVINLPDVSAAELVSFCAYARKKYYLRLWYIFHRLWKGLFDFEDFKRSIKAFKKLSQSIFK